MKKKLHAFFRDEEALTVLEYALAAGLIVATIAGALVALGISVSTIITSINTLLTS